MELGSYSLSSTDYVYIYLYIIFLEYLQRFERYREDKFLTKNSKGTQFDENIRGVVFIVFWAPTDDALHCNKFYKNISSCFKVTVQI